MDIIAIDASGSMGDLPMVTVERLLKGLPKGQYKVYLVSSKLKEVCGKQWKRMLDTKTLSYATRTVGFSMEYTDPALLKEIPHTKKDKLYFITDGEIQGKNFDPREPVENFLTGLDYAEVHLASRQQYVCFIKVDTKGKKPKATEATFSIK